MGAWCREWQSRGVIDVDMHSTTLAAEVPVADSAALLISAAVRARAEPDVCRHEPSLPVEMELVQARFYASAELELTKTLFFFSTD
jgi:hypothetical protein